MHTELLHTELSRLKVIVRQNFVFYLTGFLVIAGMKLFYSRADSGQLVWILAPTAKWVTILSGIPFVYEQDMGYVNHSLRLLIAPSCSGVQFMLILAATLIFSFVHRMGGISSLDDMSSMEAWDGDRQDKPSSRMKRGFAWTAASIGISYLLTVFVNGLRIILAIYIPLLLADWNIYFSFLTPGRLHTIIGTAVYFVSLLTIYRLAGYVSLRTRRFVKSTGTEQSTSAGSSGCRFAKLLAQASLLRKCAPPVFWYFFMVLGVPFLNRAYRKGTERFTEYAVLIISVCSTILLLFCLGSLARRLIHKRKA